MHEAQGQDATWLFCFHNIIHSLKGRSFPGSFSGVSWRIALYISSMDYTRPLGYLCVIYAGILPIPTYSRWHHFWNTLTTTDIPSHTQGKGILPHCNCSTRCSPFLIIQLQPASIEYLPLPAKPLRSFFLPLHLLFTTMSSTASCTASITQGTYQVARGSAINEAVPTVGWT